LNGGFGKRCVILFLLVSIGIVAYVFVVVVVVIIIIIVNFCGTSDVRGVSSVALFLRPRPI